MHLLVRENLEDYLSGRSGPERRKNLEAHLAECAACRQEFTAMAGSAELLRQLRPPEDADAEMAPGFYARVMERIASERASSFWSLVVEPSFGRRVVFACLMLLALLGAYVAASGPGDYPGQHRPEAMLAVRQPAPLPSKAPRLGPDLTRNRDAVLATLVAGD